MIKNNKILYGLLSMIVAIAFSLNTATAQETNQDVTTSNAYKGKVVDATTDQPLPNVEVEIEGQTVTTDDEGIFTFENLETETETEGVGAETQDRGVGSDEIEIKINHEGYQELSETVSLQEMMDRGHAQGQEQQTQQQDEQEFGQEQDDDIKTFELEPEEDY